MLLDGWNRQHDGDQDRSEVSHGVRGLAGVTGNFGRFSGAGGKNEYFQFVTDLQLRSRVEAELAIFHLKVLFALKGGDLRWFEIFTRNRS
jgi:hypothetical protein